MNAEPRQLVDIILSGGTVLTMNPSREIFAPGAVAIRGNQIAAVGPAEEIRSAYHAEETVDCRGQVIMPGLGAWPETPPSAHWWEIGPLRGPFSTPGGTTGPSGSRF